MILFWRLVSFTSLMIGIFLLIQSVNNEQVTLFYGALICCGMASLIWLIIQKLYAKPLKPNTKRYTEIEVGKFSDIANIVDVVLALPSYIFYILLRLIRHLN